MHVYKREFSVSEGNEFYLPAGDVSTCFEIDFPQEGKITRVIVKQGPQGTPVDFNVNLYDRQVCHVTDGSSEYSIDTDDMSDELAKIIPTPESDTSAGVALEYRSAEGMSYRNREGTFTVPVRKIYLEITAATDAGGSNWEVAIACLVGNESN